MKVACAQVLSISVWGKCTLIVWLSDPWTRINSALFHLKNVALVWWKSSIFLLIVEVNAANLSFAFNENRLAKINCFLKKIIRNIFAFNLMRISFLCAAPIYFLSAELIWFYPPSYSQFKQVLRLILVNLSFIVHFRDQKS